MFLVTLSDTVRGTENVSLTRFVLFDLFFNSDLRLGCLPSTHSCEVNTLTHKHANMYTGWQVSASARVAIATRSAALFALWLPRAWHRGPSVVVRSQVRRLIYLFFFFMRSHSTHGHFHTDPCTPCMNCVCVWFFCFVLFCFFLHVHYLHTKVSVWSVGRVGSGHRGDFGGCKMVLTREESSSDTDKRCHLLRRHRKCINKHDDLMMCTPPGQKYVDAFIYESTICQC